MLDKLTAACGATSLTPGFVPVARYNRGTDAINFLREDCSYTSEVVDDWLTIFWDPVDQTKPVGFRLKGLRHIYLKVMVLEELDPASENEFVNLIRLVQLVVTSLASDILKEAGKLKRYQAATRLARDVRIPLKDIVEIRQQAMAA